MCDCPKPRVRCGRRPPWVRVMAEKERDLLRIFGTILLSAGVGVWGFYAISRFGMGWHVMAQQLLPYHLAGVVPGMILQRHRFFRGLVRRLLS